MLQDVQDAIGELSQELSLQAPEHVTAHSDTNSAVYSTIVDAALRPVRYIPETAAVKVSVMYITRLRRLQQINAMSGRLATFITRPIWLPGMFRLYLVNHQLSWQVQQTTAAVGVFAST